MQNRSVEETKKEINLYHEKLDILLKSANINPDNITKVHDNFQLDPYLDNANKSYQVFILLKNAGLLNDKVIETLLPHYNRHFNAIGDFFKIAEQLHKEHLLQFDNIDFVLRARSNHSIETLIELKRAGILDSKEENNREKLIACRDYLPGMLYALTELNKAGTLNQLMLNKMFSYDYCILILLGVFTKEKCFHLLEDDSLKENLAVYKKIYSVISDLSAIQFLTIDNMNWLKQNAEYANKIHDINMNLDEAGLFSKEIYQLLTRNTKISDKNYYDILNEAIINLSRTSKPCLFTESNIKKILSLKPDEIYNVAKGIYRLNLRIMCGHIGFKNDVVFNQANIDTMIQYPYLAKTIAEIILLTDNADESRKFFQTCLSKEIQNQIRSHANHANEMYEILRKLKGNKLLTNTNVSNVLQQVTSINRLTSDIRMVAPLNQETLDKILISVAKLPDEKPTHDPRLFGSSTKSDELTKSVNDTTITTKHGL